MNDDDDDDVDSVVYFADTTQKKLKAARSWRNLCAACVKPPWEKPWLALYGGTDLVFAGLSGVTGWPRSVRRVVREWVHPCLRRG